MAKCSSTVRYVYVCALSPQIPALGYSQPTDSSHFCEHVCLSQRGISRSASVVAVMLMCGFGGTAGVTFERALAEIRDRRPQTFPNYGFSRQLRWFEANKFGLNSVATGKLIR